ncbi:hypothetical protein [Streptomyces sp. P3]|nr:hypothetical protein [Streptomyces sp. P3]
MGRLSVCGGRDGRAVIHDHGGGVTVAWGRAEEAAGPAASS